MKTYEELRAICEQTSRISERVVDEFLINYAAGHQGLEKKMEKQFKAFDHVSGKIGKEAVNLLKSQYLAHKVFRQEGLLGKFLKHPALNRFQGEERDYLMQQLKQPWRFCFSVIVDEPAGDFYTMEDVLSGERYELFSPAVSNIKNSASPILWFNLLGFNGYCWQSYGPVVYYKGFEAGDIWFFATELNPDLENSREVFADLDLNPLPYMMLISGSNFPRTFHKDDQLLFLLAEHDLDTLDTARLKKGFKTEYEKGVYRITPEQWGGHPHFAQAFFDEGIGLLLFSAMTQRGFQALVEAFNAFGFDFPAEAFLSVNMTMVSTASEVLKKKVVLNEYLDLFQTDTDPEKEKVLEDINGFIALVLPDINAGIKPDIEAAARKAGVDIQTARSVVESVLGSLDKFPRSGAESVQKKKSSKKTSSKKRLEATGMIPLQASEGVRLLSPDDELLFELHLYMMVNEVRRRAPWDYLWEDELFGVQVPGTDLFYFVSVMGSDGEFPALSFYKGFEGLARFLEFREALERKARIEQDPDNMFYASTMIGGIMCIPHMMLSFADREDLGKEDLAAVKKSGVPFRGKGAWPQIGLIIPGYVPVYPGRDSLTELFLVLKQVLVVLENVGEDEDYLFRDGDPKDCYLVRIPKGKGPAFKWEDYYLIVDPDWSEISYKSVNSEDDRKALRESPEASPELQLDMIMLPTPVRDKRKGDFFPFALLLVETPTGTVRSSSILEPEPNLQALYKSVPQKVLDELLKLGYRPSKIEIRSDQLYRLLNDVLEDAGCRVTWVNHMNEMDEAIASLISYLN